MKKFYSVLVILCWLGLPAFSQGPPPQQQPPAGVLETMKIGFITTHLNLTPAEAEKFWPIYRQYAAEKRQAFLNFQREHNQLGYEEAVLNIKKKYAMEFVKAIPPGKVNDFWQVEIEFNQFVQREWQRRQQTQGRRFPPGN
jgi:hypothetical protein